MNHEKGNIGYALSHRHLCRKKLREKEKTWTRRSTLGTDNRSEIIQRRRNPDVNISNEEGKEGQGSKKEKKEKEKEGRMIWRKGQL